MITILGARMPYIRAIPHHIAGATVSGVQLYIIFAFFPILGSSVPPPRTEFCFLGHVSCPGPQMRAYEQKAHPIPRTTPYVPGTDINIAGPRCCATPSLLKQPTDPVGLTTELVSPEAGTTNPVVSDPYVGRVALGRQDSRPNGSKPARWGTRGVNFWGYLGC